MPVGPIQSENTGDTEHLRMSDETVLALCYVGDAMNKLREATYARVPQTEDRDTYQDGYVSGYISAVNHLRETIEALIPDFHVRVSSLSTASKQEAR